MKYIFVIIALLLTGCGGHEKNILISTGKTPPMFFRFNSKIDMDRFVLDTKKYSLLMPRTTNMDFMNGEKWEGGSARDGNSIGFFNEKGYHIDITTPYLAGEYGEIERAIENGTYQFHKQRTIKKPRNQHTININNHIEHHGKEKYTCIVSSSELHYEKYGTRYRTGYNCYKFNADKTKFKEVQIRLTYNKPTNPTLAKQYTYEDLKDRAKRMLDSLYIKDEW